MIVRSFLAVRGHLAGEAGPGLLLMAAAALALMLANSPLAPLYEAALHAPLGPLDVQHWVDDGLMAVFFLFVGLEVKRELVDGDLSEPAQRRLPLAVALAGMAAPALVYLVVTAGQPGLARGWAIPSATDIAFAMGVLALVGARAPASLKLFLTTVAIVDDLGAVAIIALFYAGTLAAVPLLAAAALLGLLWLLNRAGVRALSPYLLVAALLWVAVLRSGVHATVAGVAAAAFVPLDRSDRCPLSRLEHALSPWVSYAILPLFALANAGVALGAAPLLNALPLGIALGLFLGKQAGVSGAIAAASALGVARPAGASWRQLHGVALLAGVGFTMSLFIGGLAFPDALHEAEVKLGVLTGSALSALCGFALLRWPGRDEARGAG